MLLISEGPVVVTSTFEHDVVLLPHSVDEGMGVYSQSSAVIASQLREQGLTVGYFYERNRRLVRAGLLGASTDELVIGIGTAIAGAGLWEALVAAFGKIFHHEDKPLRARVVISRNDGDNVIDTVWFEYNGPAKEFSSALVEIKTTSEHEL